MSVARATETHTGYASRSAPFRVEPGERRREPRLVCPPLFINGLSALVQDISRTGIALQLDGTVHRGEVYRLELTDAIDESSEILEAEVIWCDGKRAGLQWCNLTLEQDCWLRARFKAWMGALIGASRR